MSPCAYSKKHTPLNKWLLLIMCIYLYITFQCLIDWCLTRDLYVHADLWNLTWTTLSRFLIISNWSLIPIYAHSRHLYTECLHYMRLFQHDRSAKQMKSTEWITKGKKEAMKRYKFKYASHAIIHEVSLYTL